MRCQLVTAVRDYNSVPKVLHFIIFFSLLMTSIVDSFFGQCIAALFLRPQRKVTHPVGDKIARCQLCFEPQGNRDEGIDFTKISVEVHYLELSEISSK